MSHPLIEQIKEDTDLEGAKYIVERVIYDAGLVFERLEGKGLVIGNGHHAAQDLAQSAIEMLEERWRGEKEDAQAG